MSSQLVSPNHQHRLELGRVCPVEVCCKDSAQQDFVLQEMKNRMRNEYLGLGGSPNTVGYLDW